MRVLFKRFLGIAAYFLFLVVLLEVGLRSFFMIRYKASFFAGPQRVFTRIVYPELLQADDYEYNVGQLNILLLGGSVLEPVRKIPHYLAEAWKNSSSKPINILNVARPAHSSLDSRYKYELLKNKRFDVVVFYHGINEVRANYVAPEKWQPRYNHYSWYNNTNYFFQGRDLRGDWSILPFAWRYLRERYETKWFPERFIPAEKPAAANYPYAENPRSVDEFRRNLSAIHQLSVEKEEYLVPVSFVLFKYPEQGLDSDSWAGAKMTPMWGRVDQIIATVEEHNRVMREIADARNLEFLDLANSFSQKQEYFEDICHFNAVGGKVFAGRLAAFLQTHFGAKGQ